MSLQSALGNISKGQMPVFQEEPACAKMCPDLTFKQVKHRLSTSFLFLFSMFLVSFPISE